MTLKKLATILATALFISGSMATAAISAENPETPPGPPAPREAPYPGQSTEAGSEKMDVGDKAPGVVDTEKAGVADTEKDMNKDQKVATAAPAFDLKAANNLEGMPILNDQGQQIGEVEKVLVDMDKGQLAYVVVSQGGILGVGEDKYVVPWKAIKAEPSQNGLVVDVKAGDLKALPEGSEMQNQIDRQTGEEIHQYYGVSPYWSETGAAEQKTNSKDDMNFEKQQEKLNK